MPVSPSPSLSQAPFTDPAREAILQHTLPAALDSLNREDARTVAPGTDAVAALSVFREPLPESPSDPDAVLSLLDQYASPAMVAKTAGRYFGFVNGSCLPAALAASWMVGAWDQNAAFFVQSPPAVTLEEVALQWVCEMLNLPQGTPGAAVTAATI